MNLNGQQETIGNLTMNGGTIETNSTLSVGNLTIGPGFGVTTLANSGNSALIGEALGMGDLTLGNSSGGTDTTFNIANGNNPNGDLIINAFINGGELYKTGAGNLVLTADNSSGGYTGLTEINQGTLTIQNGGALGNPSTAGTQVDNGGQLQLQNVGTTTTEALTINGNGTANNGALYNAIGTNTYAGAITVGANGAMINTAASSNLTVSGSIAPASGSAILTVNSTGDTTFSGVVSGNSTSTGELGITKNGTGTLSLSGGSNANTFGGNVVINAGVLALNMTDGTKAMGYDTTAGHSTITVNSGGTLLSDTSNQLNLGNNLVLNGGTWVTNGSGEGSWSETLGTLTLSNTSNITLGTNNNTIQFASSSTASWDLNQILYINNWNGNLSTTVGDDQIDFSTTSTAIGGSTFTGQLGEIIFVNPTVDGVSWSGNYSATEILLTGGSYEEIVPFTAAPEPSTYAAGAALGALAIIYEWRRRKALVAVANSNVGPSSAS